MIKTSVVTLIILCSACNIHETYLSLDDPIPLLERDTIDVDTVPAGHGYMKRVRFRLRH